MGAQSYLGWERGCPTVASQEPIFFFSKTLLIYLTDRDPK